MPTTTTRCGSRTPRPPRRRATCGCCRARSRTLASSGRRATRRARSSRCARCASTSTRRRSCAGPTRRARRSSTIPSPPSTRASWASRSSTRPRASVPAPEREFVALGPQMGWGAHACQGFYHRPADTPAPRVAFIATHYNVDFSEHYLAEPLARRGFGFLGWNTRFRGAESHFVLDRALEDVDAGARWLREHGVEVLVLLGNSGGGSLLAAYEAGSQAGDLYVSVAAHPGRPDVLTGWMDPAVVDEFDPVATEPALDMYDPANGPPYTPEFLERYREAQRERNRRITAWAEAELEGGRAGGFSDRLFTLQRTWADPRFVDPSLDRSDRPTPACYAGDPARANRGVLGIGTASTLRTWLSMWSLERSACRGAEHYATIEAPALVVQATMDTGVFPSDARTIHDALASVDKRLVELRGDHYFRGEREPLADLIAGWVEERV